MPRATGQHVAKRHVEAPAGRAAGDVENFYATRSHREAATGDVPVISADREGIVTRPDAPAQRGQSGPEGRSRKTRPVPPATVGRLPRRQQPSDRPHPSASQSPTHRRHHHRRHLILVTEYLWGSTTGPSPCWKETPSTSPPIQSAPRHPAGPAKPDRTDADACAKYLTNEAAYPDYSAALPEGWPIASGVTERTCRNLVADRRNITGAEPVLKLRAVYANDDFDDHRTQPTTPTHPPHPLRRRCHPDRIVAPQEPHPCHLGRAQCHAVTVSGIASGSRSPC